MGFQQHWIDLLHRTATGTKTARTLLTPVGVIVFFLFTAVFVIVSLLVDNLLHLSNLLSEGARLLISIPIMLIGAALAAWSAYHFLKAKGTPVPFNPPPILVKTGPYHYVRNPMLTGVFLFLFGLGCFINSFSLVLFFTPLFILFNVWELKTIEEPELAQRLGEAYIEYQRQTPMFVPRRNKKGNN
jgi:protein-S-isoprenylcysteine O-methyltransferase Ste14